MSCVVIMFEAGLKLWFKFPASPGSSIGYVGSQKFGTEDVPDSTPDIMKIDQACMARGQDVGTKGYVPAGTLRMNA